MSGAAAKLVFPPTIPLMVIDELAVVVEYGGLNLHSSNKPPIPTPLPWDYLPGITYGRR